MHSVVHGILSNFLQLSGLQLSVAAIACEMPAVLIGYLYMYERCRQPKKPRSRRRLLE